MNSAIKMTVDDSIATVVIDRPEIRNAISDGPVIDAIVDAFTLLDSDPKVRVAILTGAGNVFSSGGNLKQMGRHGGLSDPSPALTRRNYKSGIQRLPLMFETLELPVVAAVNGPAIGAGCDLACMCDIRIAGESACFAESFVKVGLIPGDGGAWLLPRIVGFSKACEMALTGETVSAEEALKIGLVSRVVADTELADEARKLAHSIAANPRHAVRMTKRLLRQASVSRLEEALELSAALQALAHTTQDHVEAVDAMLEKRPPSFTGR